MKKNFYIALTCMLFFNFIIGNNLDTTFAKGVGYLITRSDNGLVFNVNKIQNDNKIICAGYSGDTNSEFAIARYNIDGDLDFSFGNKGIVKTRIGSATSTAQISSCVVQADNKILVAGFYYDDNISTQIVLARYENDGTLDTRFANNGILTDLIGDGCSAKSLAVDSNNNILVVANIATEGSPKIVLARYNENGQLDTEFATDGITITSVGTTISATDMILDNVGNVIVCGSCGDGLTSPKFMLAKYRSDGFLDESFGDNGIVLTQIGDFAYINQIALDSNNNIVAAGVSWNVNSTSSVVVARYNQLGKLDTGFNSSGNMPGVLVKNFSKQSCAESLIIDSHDNVVICGYSLADKYGILTARFTSSGILDSSFGDQGYSILYLDQSIKAKSIALQANQKIIVSGCFFIGDNNYGTLLRCNKNNTDYISFSNIINGSIFHQKTISLNGASSGINSGVNIFLDGVALESQITTDSSGNWSIPTYPSMLTEGSHVVTAQLLDNSNNVLIASSVNFTIDTSIVSAYATGNEVRVDAIFGNDDKGVRNGSPFATINKALSVAQPGDTIRIAPGIYQESFTIPDYISVRGTSSGTCIIAKNVSTDTDLVTMGEYCVLEDLTLQLTSSDHVQLKGVVFPGTSTSTSALRGIRLRVNNSTASYDGTSNIYGIHVTGTGKPVETAMSAIETSINISSIGNGNKRGILVDSAGGFNLGISIVSVAGTGSGTYIGVETNHRDADFESDVSLIQGSTADVSQTQGNITLFGTSLENLNTNGLGFATESTCGTMTFADMGVINSGTRYLCPGVYTAMVSEVPFSLSTRMLIKAINVNLLNAPGRGESVTVTLRKNGVDTLSTVTLTDNQTSASNVSNSVQFAAGDKISVSVTGSASNDASNIIVTLELY